MSIKRLTGVLLVLLFAAQGASADAPLKSVLELDPDQAKVVADIQARYRAEMRGERQTLNRESRKLRRARSANDSELAAELEPTVARLEEEMRQRILSEDDEIRKVLTPDQLQKFELHIDQRNNMVGSSRDANVLKP